MHKAVWAEWIISCYVDRNRAASIVGDFVETTALQGSLWFWLSVVRIVLYLAWRPTFAFVAALYIGLFWRREFTIQANILPYQTRPNVWYLILACLRLGIPYGNMSELHFRAVWFGTVLWIVVSYAVIRYGLRDKFAQLALGLCLLMTVVVFFSRIPAVTVVCVALALSFFAASVRSAPRRRALVALAGVLVIALGGGLLSMYLKAVLGDILFSHFPHLTVNRTVIFCFWLLAIWIATKACARAHQRLLRRDQRDSEMEPSRV
jgi:hypothetical protein